MTTIVSNFSQVISNEMNKIINFDPIQVCKTQATTTVALFRKRIHQEGIASDGSQIGTYSPGYMKVRTGVYTTNDTYKRGKNKGELKDSGLYTRGKNKGTPRPKYNRDSSTKVIASLTRQMESDMTDIPIPNGYAVGYHNVFNFEKSQFVEKTYRKKIFDLMDEEESIMYKIADDAIQNALK